MKMIRSQEEYEQRKLANEQSQSAYKTAVADYQARGEYDHSKAVELNRRWKLDAKEYERVRNWEKENGIQRYSSIKVGNVTYVPR